MKTKIKIYFSDFWPGFDCRNNVFFKILSDKYSVVLDECSPDFLFCSCFGNSFLRYNCVKIYYTGENITPDFNLFDYSIGFDYILCGDRYLRFPIYRLYQQLDDGYTTEGIFENKANFRKRKFCNFLYSNELCANRFRLDLLDSIEKYKHVECGGKIRNNIGGRVRDKNSWLKDFKFTIACENSSKIGYVTEKIFEALRANTIPIYWGDPQIDKEFNPRRFINCHNYKNLDAVVAEIRRIDDDFEEYLRMLKEPWFVGDVPPLPENDIKLREFLYNIIDQGPVASRRTIQDGFTRGYWRKQKWLSIVEPGFKIYSKLRSLWETEKQKI